MKPRKDIHRNKYNLAKKGLLSKEKWNLLLNQKSFFPDKAKKKKKSFLFPTAHFHRVRPALQRISHATPAALPKRKLLLSFLLPLSAIMPSIATHHGIFFSLAQVIVTFVYASTCSPFRRN
ncbi:hypothetical protein M441DRAFT_421359 [Trichoderma asperellum CBS 433.97]|uniref:Uncharacterized protein n=1 Tax=Trichoderma asperellum (strain ATCC 204424 / CBS 433.97 / NBRC 101777) TaxID=1042311 RepID=A0A2T3Z4W0_TRIA4|nr:hypothetical protein M441DRAFT_421359 [Trichoderma asperellum CBS 433.97]PTB39861.1 hypothetical protein M441DRAFT_421359 [Trichoderma asperellum CBS 433.97]